MNSLRGLCEHICKDGLQFDDEAAALLPAPRGPNMGPERDFAEEHRRL